MGKFDVAMKVLLSDPEAFAALFNYKLYGGRPVIKPDDLTSEDPNLEMLLNGNNGAAAISRLRDLLKRCVAKSDGCATYVFLGVENQSTIVYDMVLRCLLYDVLTYVVQARKIRRTHKSMEKGAIFSMLEKGERLCPVYTIVLYCGDKNWDAPISFRDLIDIQDESLKNLLPDYQMLLVTPADLSMEEINRLGVRLGSFMYYLQVRGDKEKFKEYIRRTDIFKVIPLESFQALDVLLNFNMKLDHNANEVDMCKAIEGIVTDAREIGIREGKEAGIREGKEEGSKAERSQNVLRTIAAMKSKHFPVKTIVTLIKEIYILNEDEEKRYLAIIGN